MIIFKQKTSQMYYGWWVVGSCFLISLFAGGFVILGFTAFFEPIVQEFGWSYAAVSLAASLRGAETGLLAPLLGFLTDRWGPRRIIFSGIIICGIGLMLLSRINSLATFYGAFALVAVGISCVSPTVVFTAVNNWFREKAGMASGIMISGFSFGGLLVPLVVKLIDVFQWRIAFLILGIGMCLIVMPISLLVKDKPRDMDLYTSKEKNTAEKHSGNVSKVTYNQESSGVLQALSSRAFWHIGLGMSLQFLAIAAILVHVMPYLSNLGISRATGSIVATAFPLISVLGRFGAGWLGDRYNKRVIATMFFSMACLGQLFFGLITSNSVTLIILSVLFFGIAWGGSAVIRVILVNEYFGRKNFGTILGLIMGIIAVGGVAGPFIVGWIFDSWSNYQAAWLLYAGLLLLATIIIVTAPNPGLKT